MGTHTYTVTYYISLVIKKKLSLFLSCIFILFYFYSYFDSRNIIFMAADFTKGKRCVMHVCNMVRRDIKKKVLAIKQCISSYQLISVAISILAPIAIILQCLLQHISLLLLSSFCSQKAYWLDIVSFSYCDKLSDQKLLRVISSEPSGSRSITERSLGRNSRQGPEGKGQQLLFDSPSDLLTGSCSDEIFYTPVSLA